MKSTVDLARFQFADARKDLAFLARTAEKVGRHDDVLRFVEALARPIHVSDLTVAERDLLAAVCTRAIESRRDAWRALGVRTHGDDPLLAAYEKQIQEELVQTCEDILDLLGRLLAPETPVRAHESSVVCLTLMGDCYRRLAELVTDRGYAEKAHERYLRAADIAGQNLKPQNPIRLGLLLNWAVCHYEILKDHKKAVEIAKKSFDEAVSRLDQLDEASYKDATRILELLRNNLEHWTGQA